MHKARTNHVLNDRDIMILRWIAQHGVVSIEQVWRQHFRATSTAQDPLTSSVYRRVRILEEMGLVQRKQARYRGPDVLLLTPRGATVADIGVPPARFVPTQVEHALVVVDLIEQLVRENPGATLVTERQIRAWQMRGRQARARTDDSASPAAHTQDAHAIPHLRRVPDALLILVSGEVIAVELDRTPKRSVDVVRIADAYAEHYRKTPLSAADAQSGWEAIAAAGTFINRVWWYARAGRTAARVRDTITTRGFARFVEVRDWEEAQWTTR